MPTPRRAWMMLWLALAAVVIGRATLRKEHRGVILDHIEFGRRLLVGEDLYGPWTVDEDDTPKALHPPYPPSYGWMTMPIALVDMTIGTRAARLSWAVWQVAMLAAIAWSLRRLPTGRAPPTLVGERRFPMIWLLALVLMGRFVLRDMHGGGGNGINVALCVLSFVCSERGQHARAGWLLGFSLATKPTQLWLLPVLLALGHRRTVAHTLLAGAALVLGSIVVLRFDVQPWLRWASGSWALATQSDPFATPALEFPPFTWMNQSLRCAIARWCGQVPAEYAALVPGGVRAGLGWSLDATAWLTRAASALLLAALLGAALRVRGATGPARTWVFAAALCASVLLSPLSWKAHHVALLPLVFLLLRRAVDERARAATGLLVAFGLCCSIGGDVLGDDTAERLNSLYVVTAFDVALLVTALWSAIADQVATPRATRQPTA